MGVGPQGTNFGGANNAQMQDQVKQHMQNKMKVDDADYHVWFLISDVPTVQKPVAFVAGVINFILPGFGTLLAACVTEDSGDKT